MKVLHIPISAEKDVEQAIARRKKLGTSNSQVQRSAFGSSQGSPDFVYSGLASTVE